MYKAAGISAPTIKGENFLKNLEPCLRDIAIDQCEMTLKAHNLLELIGTLPSLSILTTWSPQLTGHSRYHRNKCPQLPVSVGCLDGPPWQPSTSSKE